MSSRSILSALALTAAALVAGPAQADVLAPNGAVSCSDSLVTDNLANNPTFLDCAGAFDGNNKGNATTVDNVLDTIDAEFGLTGLTNIFDVSAGAGTSGTFDLSAINGAFVLALKAGDAFSLYAFSDGDLIDWDTLGVGFTNPGGQTQSGQDLSHATVYTAAIPEPETYALMMAGLAFVGWASRRRQRRQ